MKNEDFDNEIDSLLDDFEFKPITDGLGFHHSIKEEKEVKLNLASKSKSLKEDFDRRVTTLSNQASIEKQLQQNEKDQKSVNMGELAPFYQDSHQVSEEVGLDLTEIEKVEAESVEVEQANLFFRSLAWGIDFAIVLTSIVMTALLMIFTAELPMEVLNSVLVTNDIFVGILPICSMFYLFYFSFFEKTQFSTIGKRICGIKVESYSGQMTMLQAFGRALISLVSIPMMGLPTLLKFHDFITNTFVVKR